MTAPSPPVVRLLGIDFADLGVEDAAAVIAARPPHAPFATVVTPNADHLVRLAHQPELAPLYQKAWMRLLDSRVVARLAGAMGLAVPQVATGSDLTMELLRRHLTGDRRLTVIGLAAEHLPALRARLPGASIAHFDPPRGMDANPAAFAEAVAFACAHPARYTMLAVGSPRQERLAAAIAEAGGTGVGLCIGAALEFAAGAVARAPVWMQRAGLEWFHRLAQDPRRLARRYLLEDPAIITMLLKERIRVAREGPRAPRS